MCAQAQKVTIPLTFKKNHACYSFGGSLFSHTFVSLPTYPNSNKTVFVNACTVLKTQESPCTVTKCALLQRLKVKTRSELQKRQ